jgi:radical SAM protein with 4Fe4S-binding SPASM domain
MDYQNKTVEIEIGADTVIELPDNIHRKEIHSKTLIIAEDQANWIVLFNEKQRNIFDLINEKLSIGSISTRFNDADWDDFNFVVSQIFDRNFTKQESFFNDSSLEGMYIYLTDKCNLCCKHCYMFSGKKKDSELSINDWKRIIDNFKNTGGKSITFTGGEVLMYKDWAKVIRYTKEQGFSVTILSNGTLWNQEAINEATKYIDEIQISLDGISEKTNAMIRGAGNFDTAMQTAILFANQNVKTKITTTPTIDNIHLIKDDYVNFSKKILKKVEMKGVIHFKIAQKLLEGREVKVTKTERQEYQKITHKIANSLYPNYSVENFISNLSYGGIKNCGYGGLSVSSNGEFFLCNRVLELESIGNVDTLFSVIINKARRLYEITCVDNVEECNDCELKYICGGGCRIDEYKFAGIHTKIKEGELLRKKKKCSPSFKQSYYNKMIQSIEFIYDNEG